MNLSFNIWWMTARPRTLWAAVSPVLVGCGLAVGDGVFHLGAGIAALAGALAIQVGVNYANDASDAKRGADPAERLGPARAVASGHLTASQVWIGAWCAFAAATTAGVYLTIIAGWVIPVVGAASILAALAYTGGPWPYGYRGLGEVIVFLFFGLIATVTSRYVHGMTAPADAWLCAIPIGFLVTAILVANNIRDIDTDAEAGKRTLAVILGRAFAGRLYLLLVAGSFALIALLGAAGLIPRWTLLSLLAAPLMVAPIRTIRSATSGPDLIRVLEATARLNLLVGIGLAVGSALG